MFTGSTQCSVVEQALNTKDRMPIHALVLLHTINMRNVASTLMLFYVVQSRVLVT